MMIYLIIGLMYVAALGLGYLIGVEVTHGRKELERISRDIEIRSMIRNARTDVVDRTYCFGKENGYELFKINQN